MSRLPDTALSRAILVGVSDYVNPELPDLPSIRNNLTAIAHLTGDPMNGTISPRNCYSLPNPTRQVFGEAIRRASTEAKDVLFVYYSGHGIVDNKSRLNLTLPDSDPENLSWTALPFDQLREELASSNAIARVLILDCCYSGRAIEAMAPTSSSIAGQLDIYGTYVITSSTGGSPSAAPVGDRYTAFTGAIIETVLEKGPATLEQVFDGTDRILRSRGLPRPQQKIVNRTGNLVLFRSPELHETSIAARRFTAGSENIKLDHSSISSRLNPHGTNGVRLSEVDTPGNQVTPRTPSGNDGRRPKLPYPGTAEEPPRATQRVKTSGRRKFIVLASSAVGSIAASGLAHRFLNASSAADTVPPEPTAPISDSTPKFTGNIAIVDVSGGEVVNTTSDLFPAGIQKYIADTEIYLASSPQAIFLESLGFTYPDKLTREEGEGDKRALHGDFESIPIGFHPRLAGYLIVSRSDSYAGSGSERGLPLMITNRGADLIVLDNPEAVEALRHWSSHSEKILLEQLVPLLEQTVS